jgi:hypothetical protein
VDLLSKNAYSSTDLFPPLALILTGKIPRLIGLGFTKICAVLTITPAPLSFPAPLELEGETTANDGAASEVAEPEFVS